jgi:hypothetical protein
MLPLLKRLPVGGSSENTVNHVQRPELIASKKAAEQKQ